MKKIQTSLNLIGWKKIVFLSHENGSISSEHAGILQVPNVSIKAYDILNQEQKDAFNACFSFGDYFTLALKDLLLSHENESIPSEHPDILQISDVLTKNLRYSERGTKSCVQHVFRFRRLFHVDFLYQEGSIPTILVRGSLRGNLCWFKKCSLTRSRLILEALIQRIKGKNLENFIQNLESFIQNLNNFIHIERFQVPACRLFSSVFLTSSFETRAFDDAHGREFRLRLFFQLRKYLIKEPRIKYELRFNSSGPRIHETNLMW